MSTEISVQEQWDAQRRKVDVDQSDVGVREIIRMVVDGEMKIAPEYQRQFRWPSVPQSRLVESILLGLPVPNLFVATNADGTWEVVDGLQRISTLLHFAGGNPAALAKVKLDGPLVLEGLEKLTELNGATFEAMPMAMQLAFYKRPLRIVAISDKSDPSVRFDMFERLNNGGVVLTPQEIRACVYRGRMSDLLRELALETNFISLVKLQSAHQNDGTREEIALKFFAYLNHRDHFDGEVKLFLNDYMKTASPGFDTTAGRTLFVSVCTDLAKIVGGPILRSGYNLTPINQLEAIMVAAGELHREGKKIKMPKNSDWLNDEVLVKFSTKGTNTKSALAGRIERARALLQGKK